MDDGPGRPWREPGSLAFGLGTEWLTVQAPAPALPLVLVGRHLQAWLRPCLEHRPRVSSRRDGWLVSRDPLPFRGPQGSALHPCCHGPLSELRACDQLHDLAAPGKGFLEEQDHSCLVPCGVHGRTPGGMAVLTAFCRVTTVDESMRVCHRSAVLRLPPLPTKPSELWGDPSSSGDGEADVVQRTQGPH